MTREELLNQAKPILFNTEMVKAILEGRKTVTRRVIKNLPEGTNRIEQGDFGAYEAIFGRYNNGCFAEMYQVITPPYAAGDYLYVRESVFQGVAHSLDMSGETVGFLTDDFEYFADGTHEKDHWKDKNQNVFMRRRPSIHMPKEAARLFLKVTDVRVEQLQEMDEDDAFAEGVSPWDDRCYARNGWKPTFHDPDSGGDCLPLHAFEDIWNSTIKKQDLDTYGWNANPWVWVIEFERIEV